MGIGGGTRRGVASGRRPAVHPAPRRERRVDLGRGLASVLAAEPGDQLGERRPVDELHGVVVDAALAADRVHRDDVRVVELRGGLGLDAEPGDLAGVDGGGERQDLQRHAAAQRALDGLVDDAHAAAAQLADDAEVADPWGRRHRPARGPDRRSGIRTASCDVAADGPAGPGATASASAAASTRCRLLQAGAEPPGDGRVPADPLLGIDRPAGLDLGEVGVEHRGQLVLASASPSSIGEPGRRWARAGPPGS